MKQFNKNIVSINDMSKEDIVYLLDLAQRLDKLDNKHTLLTDKVISSLFFEPSTRTRLSFASAANKLGARVIGFDNPDGSSLKKGESLIDTLKMAEVYSDLIVMRHSVDGAARLGAENVSCAFLNAGDGSNQHPSQTLLDLYTIKDELGTLENIEIAFVGDLKYGRTVHSLTAALKMFNAKIHFVAPPNLQIQDSILRKLDEAKIKYELSDNLEPIINKVDVIYMTRIQRERFADGDDYEKVKGCYILNKDLLMKQKPKKNMIILHPLPRVGEISTDVDELPYAKYFQQAANGVPVRQAMIMATLNLTKRIGDK